MVLGLIFRGGRTLLPGSFELGVSTTVNRDGPRRPGKCGRFGRDAPLRSDHISSLPRLGSQGGPCRLEATLQVLGARVRKPREVSYGVGSFITGSRVSFSSIRSFALPGPFPFLQSSWGALQFSCAPLSVSSRIGRTYLSDPLVSQVHGVGCGKMEPPECAFRRSPGWRSGGRRVCVVGGGLDPPAPLKTPEYQWWGRIENKFICQILPDK